MVVRWRSLCCPLLLLAVAACRVYDTDLVDGERARAARGDAGTKSQAVTTDAVSTDAPPLAECERGSCFWSRAKEGCQSAGVPGPQFRPAAETDVTEIGADPEIYLALSELHMTATAAPDAPRPPDAKAFGFDLDGVCTSSLTCPESHAQSCRVAADMPLRDEAECRDNALSGLMAIVRQIPDVADRLGLSETAFNCELTRGGYNILVRITDYNGGSDDPSVRVDWYTSSGLETKPEWACPADPEQQARWARGARFAVDPRELLSAIAERGRLPASRVSDSSAYVRHGYLVSRLPDGALLRLAGDGKPLRGFSMLVQKAFWVGKLAKSEEEGWTLSDGMIAGRTRVDDMLQSLRQTGFCKQSQAGLLFDSVASYVQRSADVLASGLNDAGAACDALSFGIAFNAREATPGGSARALEPLLECCEPGMAPLDCQPQCGDGQLTGKERCDTAIPAGKPGACPTSCSAQAACDQMSLEGVGCEAHCVRRVQTQARSGDGCCPPGATSSSDSDCVKSCGNGVLEPGETCDPKSGCPSCETKDRCTIVKSSGSAETCNLVCSATPVTACRPGDGCCPSNCSRSTDSDCSATCGDGRLDAGETCEPNSSTPCPASCDDDNACTRDVMSGSPSTCNVSCTHWQVTAPMAGDGCCPPGANRENDADCGSQCGNGAREQGEDCDDGNTADGDGCNATCRMEPSEDMCKTRVASRKGASAESCVECVCSRCTKQANDCYGATSEREIELCDGVVACARENACSGAACYCGADLLACAVGYPTGPCRTPIERAAGTSSAARLSGLSRDTGNAFGRASLFGECAFNSCADACGLRAP